MSSFNASTLVDVLGTDLQAAVQNLSLYSDFYLDAENVTRGVTLDSMCIEYPNDLEQFDVVPTGLKRQDCQLDSIDDEKVPKNTFGADISRPAFFDEDEAPPIPEDDLFQLSLTTMTAKGMTAAQLANAIIEFLDRDVASSRVTKVNRRKLTVKATVHLESFHCEVKVRLYSKASKEYSVEVQRRSGDAIAFNRLWQGICHHLNSCMDNLSGEFVSQLRVGTAIEHIMPECPLEKLESSERSFEPLLNLAESADKRLQAEAVLVLAHAVEDMTVAVHLCTPQVLRLLLELSHVVCFEILEPLSRMILHLSRLPQAQALPEMHALQESFKVACSAEESRIVQVY